MTAGAQSPLPVTAGATATYSITVSFNGNNTNCTANLSATPTASPAWPAAPPGGFFTFTPPSVTGNSTATSSLTVTTPASTVPNTYHFTLAATRAANCNGNGGDPSSNVDLVVGAPVATTLNLAPVGSATFGFAGAFTLTAQLRQLPGGVTPVAGATVSFLVDGSAVGTATSNAGGTATFNYSPGSLNVGTHPVTAVFAGQVISNVSFTGSTGGPQNLTITQAPQAIAFTSTAPAAAVVAGPTYTVAATGGGSGNPVLFTSGTPTTCSVAGNVVSMLAVGTCTIKANQAGNSNYLSAPEATQSFQIAKGTATIVLSNLSQTYDRTAKAATATTTPSGLAVTFAYTLGGNPVASPVAAGSYAVTATINDANYQGSTTGTLVIAPLSITGTFTAANRPYDATTAAAVSTRSLAGVISPDVVSLTGGTATFANKNVGVAKTVTGTGFTLSGANAVNYVLAASTLTASADITARTLVVTATGVNKVYDRTTAATVTISTDRIVGDDVTPSFTSATFVDKNVGAAKTINVAGITIAGADALNYLPNTTCVTTADITAKSVTGSFTADNKVYDGLASATISARNLSGTIAGDVVSLTGGVASFADKNVGTGKTVSGTGFSLTGGDATNYALASSSLTTTANITARALTRLCDGRQQDLRRHHGGDRDARRQSRRRRRLQRHVRDGDVRRQERWNC